MRVTRKIAGSALGISVLLATSCAQLADRQQSPSTREQRADGSVHTSEEQVLSALSFSDAKPSYGSRIGQEYNDMVYRNHTLQAVFDHGDASTQRSAAKVYEEQGGYLTAFVLYDAAGDREGMKRMAAKSYVAEFPYRGFLLERAGIPIIPAQETAQRFGLLDADGLLAGTIPTPAQYAAKGAELLEQGNLDDALSAYEEAKDDAGIRAVAVRAEARTRADTDSHSREDFVVAFAAYQAVHDTIAEQRMAEWLFITSPQYGSDPSLLRTFGMVLTSALWEQRAQWQEQHEKDCPILASEAYANARNAAGLERTLRACFTEKGR